MRSGYHVDLSSPATSIGPPIPIERSGARVAVAVAPRPSGRLAVEADPPPRRRSRGRRSRAWLAILLLIVLLFALIVRSSDDQKVAPNPMPARMPQLPPSTVPRESASSSAR